MQSKRLLPIGIQSFSDLRNRGCLYVDKTDLVYKAASEGKPYFLSRPRRFGKSLLLSTFAAYFEGKKELFEGLRIAGLEKDWISYPVISISFAGDRFTDTSRLNQKIDFILRYYEDKWGVVPRPNDSFSNRLSLLILDRFQKTGRQTVILIDEYDKPVLDAIYSECETVNRDILQGFYSPLKELDEYIRFIFITGITKISHVNIFSGLNMLDDISMNRDYATICGITEAELKENFASEIEALAQEQDMTSDQALAKLKEMYDGYHFTKDNEIGLYNPFSLLKSFNQRDFGYYWFDTATPTMLIKTLENKPADLLRYADDFVSDESDFKNYEPENNNVLPVIYQSGYLTIKDYDRDSELYTLGLPNKEVEKGLYKIIIPKFTTIEDNSLGLTIERLRQSFRAQDIDAVLEMLKAAVADIPTMMKKEQCENYYEAITHVIFRQTGFGVQSELQSLRGRSDVTVITKDAVFIFELKMDKGEVWEAVCDRALAQIDEKGYADRYAVSGKKIFRVAVVFSSEAKGIVGWKYRQ